MTERAPIEAYRTYWVTWSILLVLTLVMLVLDQASLPRLLFVLVIVAAMLTKASLIGGYFMHLRLERVALAIGVVVGLLVTGVLLYFLIIVDAYRIQGMSGQ